MGIHQPALVYTGPKLECPSTIFPLKVKETLRFEFSFVLLLVIHSLVIVGRVKYLFLVGSDLLVLMM